MEKQDSVGKKLFSTYSISIVCMCVWYLFSRILPKSIRLIPSESFGFLILLLLSISISFVWLFTYWRMDILKHEPMQLVIYTFLSGAFVHTTLHATITSILGYSIYELSQGSFNLLLVGLLRVLLPVCSFYISFLFYVSRLQEFDEPVDALIYGSFIGIGIAFSICLIDFMSRESISIQYLILSMITKTTLYAAVGASTGFFIMFAFEKKAKIACISAFLCVFVSFFAKSYIENHIYSDISLASSEFIQFLISIGLILLIIVITILLILQTLKSTISNTNIKVSNKESKSPKNLKWAFYLILLLICSTLFLKLQSEKTVPHNSNDNRWTFNLPSGFTLSRDVSLSNVFINSKTFDNNIHYVKRYQNTNELIDLYIRFLEKKELSKALTQFSLLPTEEQIICLKTSRKNINTTEQNQEKKVSYTYYLSNDVVSALVEIRLPEDNNLILNHVVKTLQRSMRYGE